MLRTRLCELLGIEHPLVNAPMATVAFGDLAAAVLLRIVAEAEQVLRGRTAELLLD